jgi:hypothetical protein
MLRNTMTAIIYTYPLDYIMAAYSARVMALQGLRVILAIDKGDPGFVCDWAETVRTKFDRHGNLNGKEFILGHLRLMLETSDGADYVFKVDSDTIVLDAARFLDGRDEVAVGIWSNHMDGMQGRCYALRTDALPAMIEEAEKLDDSPHYMEDKTIGLIAAKVGNVHLPVYGDDPNSYSYWSNEHNAAWCRSEKKTVVSFSLTNGATRKTIAEAMKTF